MDEYGTTMEEALKNIGAFAELMKQVIEAYLTEEEVLEINNPRTSDRRIKQLISLSNLRMMSDTETILGHKY